jgi:hypothetical protein
VSGAEDWDWSLRVFDHVDLRAGDYAESVRFYEAVLAPLGIPKLSQRQEGTCFTNLNVVDRARQPRTFTSASTRGRRGRLMPSTGPGSWLASAPTLSRGIAESVRGVRKGFRDELAESAQGDQESKTTSRT